jgi:hypothetical protein
MSVGMVVWFFRGQVANGGIEGIQTLDFMKASV